MAKRLSAISRTASLRSGDCSLPQAPGSAIFNERVWRKIARSLDLSGRELQVVRGVFDNHAELTIAAGLAISSHTVHTHIKRLYQKLAVTNRAQLVLRVINEFLALAVTPQNPMLPFCAIRAAGYCPRMTAS